MPCATCAIVDASNSQQPFVTPNGSKLTHFYQCPECNQWWMQFNKQFHLWQKISEERRNGARIESRAQSQHL